MSTRLTKRLLHIPAKDLAQILAKIASIDEFKGWWKGSTQLNPQALGRLKKLTVITSTGSSTRIEGSKLSNKDVEKLLKGLKLSKLTDRDSQEVAGYAELLQMVFDQYHGILFSEGVILQFHQLLLRYSEKDKFQKGRYKSRPNQVVAFDKTGGQTVLFNPTEPHLTGFEMRELFEWMKLCFKEQTFHPLLIIANFIIEFLAIHPFHDGNGRLSRVLTNLLLAQAGYAYMPYASLEKLIEENKIEYYLALREGQKNIKSSKAKITKWVHFFLDCMLKQIEILKTFLENSPQEVLLSENQKKTLTLFDHSEEISNRLVSAQLKIPSITAKQILNRLVELRFIEKLGLGRSTRYKRRFK